MVSHKIPPGSGALGSMRIGSRSQAIDRNAGRHKDGTGPAAIGHERDGPVRVQLHAAARRQRESIYSRELSRGPLTEATGKGRALKKRLGSRGAAEDPLGARE